MDFFGNKYLSFLALGLCFWGIISLVRYLRERGKPRQRDLATRLREREEED